MKGFPGKSLRGYSARELSDETALYDFGPGMTQQHFADDADINTIMRRFGVTRQLPLGSESGVYGDFTGISDYESAVERLADTHDRFMKLPPELRERFGNDPGQLIQAASDLSESEFGELVRVTPSPVPVVEPVVAPVPAGQAKPGGNSAPAV